MKKILLSDSKMYIASKQQKNENCLNIYAFWK
jgi:hypothetical protein